MRLYLAASSVVLVLVAAALGNMATQEKSIHFITYNGDVNLKVRIANTTAEREEGLMGVMNMPEDQGMLFIFSRDKERVFWMKDTLISLDMIFVNSNNTIVSIVEGATPCTKDPCDLYYSEVPAKYVIETNAGFVDDNKIAVNNKVFFGI